MIDSFRMSFRLKDTYRTNSFIYMLKSIPLVKKLIPASLYASKGLKRFAHIISIIEEIISVFLGKGLYLGVMVFFPLSILKSNHVSCFLHILLFLTLIGGVLNTHMFTSSKDKYYAMFLMRMDANKYVISNYLYDIAKTIVGFMVMVILFGSMVNVPVIACILIPFYVVSVKCIINALVLQDMSKKQKATDQVLPVPITIGLAVLLLAAAYGLPYLGFAIPVFGFYIVCGITIIGAIPALRYILNFTAYRPIYKELLEPDDFIQNDPKAVADNIQSTYQKKLDYSVEQTSSKTGYAYFNELFNKRHSRLLTKSAFCLTIIIAIIFIIMVICCFVFSDISVEVNSLMLTYLPYFLFIMYMINRGQAITEAMFMNCDHSMLTYRFYRQPKVILNLFAARLKTVIVINLMPALVIAVGLPLLLYLTGGTKNPLNYVLLFVSIISMSVFFSVHNMVLYYLLQPYNINLEKKNPTYSIISTVTYVVCYSIMKMEMPTIIFGTIITAFCILYIIVALILAYKLAPKTFKLMD